MITDRLASLLLPSWIKNGGLLYILKEKQQQSPHFIVLLHC